ncbi:HNH endonuclease [Actinomycetospora sp. OC33-EN08]|uniref:HNH endonuclease n=1 Tax=Actinomycetospora aurantiaca TaxID=3129233 RepID=A0ABU8MHG5_9PSEU
MAFDDVTGAAVTAALQEFDRLGRDQFLEATGFGHAKSYFLEHDGNLYDSKAIVGYAHGISGDRPWRASDFSGGEKTVADLLRALGFSVRFVRNPAWTRDEIVLACALVEAHDWRTVAQERPEVVELSRLLQSRAIHPLEGRTSDFRNPAGVERKTGDLVSCLPGHRRTNGNRLDIEVVDAFRARPSEMRDEARAIEVALREWGDGPHSIEDPDLLDVSANEGSAVLRAHLRRERSASLRRRKIADARRQGREIACEACGFNFETTYGDRGADYIECHHRTPLHESGPVRTRLDDLALICSNCHRMIHRTVAWLRVDELTDLLRRQRGQTTVASLDRPGSEPV